MKTKSAYSHGLLVAVIALAGCGGSMGGAFMPGINNATTPESSASAPSTRSQPPELAKSPPNGHLPLEHQWIQFKNNTAQELYPQLTQPPGWITDRPPKPMPPGGGDLPIFLGANSADPIPDYTVLWSNTDPPGSGTLFTAHYNPGAADPFTYEGSPGDGLTITQSEHTTSGGVHITVFTLNAMGLSHRDLGRSTRAGNSGRSYF